MDDNSARFRIRLLGAFSPVPGGRRLMVSSASFAEALAAAALRVEVTVPDRLGVDAARIIVIHFDKLRSFTTAEVVGAVPVLAALRELGERLAAGTTTAEAAIEGVRELVGDGPIARSLASMLAPTPPPAPAQAPAPAGPGDPVDAIFAAGAMTPGAGPGPGPAASAIDSFVRTMRGAAGATVAPSPVKGARAARAMLEEAVFATARDVLTDPLVAPLEGAWRGLKLVLEQCPTAASIAVEVVDVAAAGLLQAFSADLSDDESERPDLYVVTDAVASVDTLNDLARAAEAQLAPVVVAVAPSIFGATTAAALAEAADAPGGLVHEGWAALRTDETSRWLCAAVNRGVVFGEGAGVAHRVAFASPALALAAMLAASFRDTRAFARIFGGAGALEAPATREVVAGREAGTAVPTEAFYSLRAQAALASAGLVGLGSPRNSSKITLSAAPTLRHSTDAVPLPAQMLTGRLVRFASWVRRELPASVSDSELASLFEQAAQVFILAGMGPGAQLRAGVGRDEQNRRAVEIAVNVSAELAAIPYQFAFTLPLE